ncbi:P-loop ATPase, Sll1717 family [Paenibacillus glufosinatiresistens]|uniref:P-loop ATPase, Sll1717 family n=1 Tax=Paenibacillus glufosinatiresistens TaxID=3070657 RepID=UPI00286E2419|nr:hypothetical protein [Paenibacillus sp. YX.27]
MAVTFSDFNFGYADADTELRRSPYLFDVAFYDRKKVVEELIKGYKFIVLGRKGVGKSAYGAKIQRLSSQDQEIVSEKVDLSDFEFNTFSRLSSSNQSGAARYSISWKMILLLKIFSVIDKNNLALEHERFQKILKSLKDNGILPNEKLSKVIRKVSKNGFNISIPYLSDFLSGEVAKEQETILSNPAEITETLLEILEEIYLGNNKVFIIIDGLDDSLRGKSRQLDIVAGLIRAAATLNNELIDFKLPIKIIVLARTDIYTTFNDPDLNKVKRDSQISIDWNFNFDNPFESDLYELIKLRFLTAEEKMECTIDELWHNLFPEKVEFARTERDSLSFVIEHTLNKPRDVLQFLIECQINYPENTCLSQNEFLNVLSKYSENYFLEEMKNELAGFISDSSINAIPGLLSRLGRNRTFTHGQWLSEFNEDPQFKKEDSKMILEMLFDGGYIGQLRRRGEHAIPVYKYRESHEKIMLEDRFIIHRGLWKALNMI